MKILNNFWFLGAKIKILFGLQSTYYAPVSKSIFIFRTLTPNTYVGLGLAWETPIHLWPIIVEYNTPFVFLTDVYRPCEYVCASFQKPKQEISLFFSLSLSSFSSVPFPNWKKVQQNYTQKWVRKALSICPSSDENCIQMFSSATILYVY